MTDYATHPDWLALLRGVCEDPADDLPRLVAADWLEEYGDGDRAEFIRLQIEQALLPERSPEWWAIQDRIRPLLGDAPPGEYLPKFWAWFMGDLWTGFFSPRVRRGFVESFGVPHDHIGRLARVAVIHPATEIDLFTSYPNVVGPREPGGPHLWLWHWLTPAGRANRRRDPNFWPRRTTCLIPEPLAARLDAPEFPAGGDFGGAKAFRTRVAALDALAAVAWSHARRRAGLTPLVAVPA